MSKTKLALIFLFLFTFLSTQAFAAPKPKIESRYEFDNAIYYRTYESWGPEHTTTVLNLIKFFDSNDNYKYVAYISYAGRQSFPLNQTATIQINDKEYPIKQIEERTQLEARIFGSNNYTLYAIPEDLIKVIAETPEQTEISLLMPNLAKTEIYKAVLKAGLRSSITAMYPLTRADFDTYDKQKPKETDEVPKIVVLRSGW